MSDKWFSPGFQPPAAPNAKPAEPLWTICVNHVNWTAELRFHGESYGWETLFFRDGEFFSGRRYPLRAGAAAWADEIKRDIERGWADY